MGKIYLAILATACGIFLYIGSLNLERQGLYYDEVVLAPSSFAYIGKPQKMGNCYSWGGYPLLNMSYNGALRSAVYGLYLRFFQAKFSVLSWRLPGLLFVVLALGVFGLLVRASWSPLGLALFYAFLVSDTSALLMTRHDWGPVALALALRLLFIGIWLREEGRSEPGFKNSLVLGGIVGFSIYEKLSNVVLVFPLFIIMMRRQLSHFKACILGVFVGSMPLIIINAMNLCSSGKFISLKQAVITFPPQSWNIIWKYFCLGAGGGVKLFICGVSTASWFYNMEGFFLSSALVAIGFLALLLWREGKWFKLAGMAAFSYLVIRVGLSLLPAKTLDHHWIIGTPFQYAAIALAFMGLCEKSLKLNAGVRILRWLFVMIVVSFLIYRAFVFGSLEMTLNAGKFSDAWSPEYTDFAKFAAKRSSKAFFMVADRGFSAQIICMGNGETQAGDLGLLRTAQSLGGRIKQISKNEIYVVFRQPPSGAIAPGILAQTLPAMRKQKDWQEVEVEREVKRFKLIRVYKFIRKLNG